MVYTICGPDIVLMHDVIVWGCPCDASLGNPRTLASEKVTGKL